MTEVPVPVAGIQVWRFGLDGGSAADAALLDDTEAARAQRFVFAADRARFVRAHAQLRRLLGRALGLPPRDLVLLAGPQGRPMLAGGPVGVDFNLSHSGGCAALALCRDGRQVGVDVELLRPVADALPTAREVFTDEELLAWQLRAEPERDQGFLALWTRKEAVLKALGTGLSLAPRRLQVGLGVGVSAVQPPDGLPAAQVLSLVAGTDVAMALAWTAPP